MIVSLSEVFWLNEVEPEATLDLWYRGRSGNEVGASCKDLIARAYRYIVLSPYIHHCRPAMRNRARD